MKRRVRGAAALACALAAAATSACQDDDVHGGPPAMDAAIAPDVARSDAAADADAGVFGDARAVADDGASADASRGDATLGGTEGGDGASDASTHDADAGGAEAEAGDAGCVWTLREVSHPQVGADPSAIAIADMNADGKLDLIVTNAASANVSVLLGNGDGTYRPQIGTATGMDPLSLAVGDLNDDGILDLAVTAFQGPASGTALLGNGDGTFQLPIPFTAGLTSGFVAMGDFNRDGKRDLAVTNLNSAGLSILLGQGDGTFSQAVSYVAGAVPVTIAIADLNADRNPDLAVVSEEEGVGVLLGVGDGTFLPQKEYVAGTYPGGIAVGDLDGDGALDLVVANSGGNTGSPSGNSVSVLLGNGDGSFRSETLFSVGDYPDSVAIGDLDGDGHPDLVVANAESAGISVLLGRGDGTFAPQIVVPTTTGASAITVADLDGDGRLDVAVANGSTSVSVLSSACLPPSASTDAGLDAGVVDAGPEAEAGDAMTGPTCIGPGVNCGGVCVDVQTDRYNCGACGNTCYLPECSAGSCITFPLYFGTGSGFPYDIAVDGTSVYFTDDQSVVMKVGIDGGAPTVLASNTTALRLAIDSSHVYWADGVSINSVPLDGGAVTTVVAAPGAVGIAVDSQNVYWATTSVSADGIVVRAPLDGGTPVTLATGQDDPQVLRVNSTAAYWVNADIFLSPSGSVMSVPLDGGAVTTIAPSENLGVNSMALDSTYVYWSDSIQAQILKAPVGGGPAVTLGPGMGAAGIAVDATGVYCAAANGITRIPLDGGPPVLVARGFQSPMAITLDRDNVYWTDIANIVFRARK